MELDQLKAIFEDRTEKELKAILCRHNNNVEAAVDAICNAETISAQSCGDSPFTHENDASETTIMAGGVAATCTDSAAAHLFPFSPTIVKLPPPESPRPPPPPPAYSWSSPPTITTPPTTNQRSVSSALPIIIMSDSAEQRRRTLFEAQRTAREQEEAELQRALENSMSPSDRGLDHISDRQLSELMNDPAFLASLDSDLRAAIELQTQLDTAESEEWHHQSMDAKQTKRTAFTRSIFLSPLPSSPRLLPTVQNKLQVLGASFLRARSTLGISTNEEDELVQRLEAMNEENVEEQFRRRIRREAEAACMRAVKDHLESFLQEHPDASYENWIEELHPENAHEGLLLEGLGKTLDHRLYVEDSDHRKLWNESLTNDNDGNTCSRRFVPARTTKVNKGNVVVDLLS
jgi:hypothetical protein